MEGLEGGGGAEEARKYGIFQKPPGESLCPGGSEFTYDRLLGTHIYCIFETEPND